MRAERARIISENNNPELTEILIKIKNAAMKGETEICEDISDKTENMLIVLGYQINGRGISW